MKTHSNTNPYEFTIRKDGDGWYEYLVRTVKTQQPVCGGIVKNRRHAEQQARTSIANLPRG